ncbi:NAD(P)/FAD-dependent oxidoreductase [Streptomyces sp. TRM 70361]|uniref:flavin monoamine oxidase family protein n=1 Tax=Streptomyces sp. TRM 70361 TaxID=3116553 RepID=UPI002E7BA1B1|nr:NAD(P)/FAD-dependent oxidoreductase [Streptomyces sp. TRM 70361]MEE1938031.1 NAD(P)/FAD-dependent oxidoreductase [Streptomyces sp. TRM 70361]
MTTDYDAIVVGAGFAGVTAARGLRAAGRRTLLLEARDRIGGRTWTEEFAGRRIELGGAWIHWNQPHIWAELTRYGIPVVADEEPEEILLATEEEPLPLPADDVLMSVTELLNRVFRDAADYFPRPYDPLFRADLLDGYDQLSLTEHLARTDLTAEERNLVTGVLATELGGRADRSAVSMPAQWWSLGSLDRHGYHSIVSIRPEPGTLAVLEAMLADSPPELRLGSPVAAVADEGGRVVVTTRAGERFSARTAVVAVPVNMWPAIDFSPGLPAAHTAVAGAGMGVADSVKLWLRFRSGLGRFIAQGAPDAPISLLMPHSESEDGVHLMTGFSVDPSFDAAGFGEVEKAVRRLVPDAELIDYRAHDWGRDPFSRGGWGNRRPGHLINWHRALGKPHGRVVFAGGDLADGWAGCIDGAVESGLRAARQAVRYSAPEAD